MTSQQAESLINSITRLVSGVVWLDGFKTGLIIGALAVLTIFCTGLIARSRSK